jgi:WD40 repeat protein
LRHARLSDFVFLDGGKTVLTAGDDRVLRLWDVASGKQTRQVQIDPVQQGAIETALSPDGKLFADGTLSLRSVETGNAVKKRTDRNINGMSQFFSPDGRTLLVATMECEVHLWNHETNSLRRLELPAPTRMLDTIDAQFSEDGKWLVIGGQAFPHPCIIELPAQRMSYQLTTDASSIAVSKDSKRLAVTSTERAQQPGTVICIFDLPTGKEVTHFSVGSPGEYFTNLAFSPDGKSLVCGSKGDIYLVNTITGQALHKISHHADRLAFTPDGKLIAGIGGRDLQSERGSYLRFWDTATGKEQNPRPGDLSWATALSPDGRIVASAEPESSMVYLWDSSTGSLLRRLATHGDRFASFNLVFSADGQTLTALQSTGHIESWNVADGFRKLSKRLKWHGSGIMHISPNATTAYTLEHVMLGIKPNVRLAHWAISTGGLVKQFDLGESSSFGPFSASATSVVVGFRDGIGMVDLNTGLSPFLLPNSDSRPGQNCVYNPSPDFRLIAAVRRPFSSDLDVWEMASGKKVASISIPHINDVSILPDNRTVLATDRGSVYAWDLATGNELGYWQVPELAFGMPHGDSLRPMPSADSRRALTVLPNTTCLIWDLAELLKPKERLAGAPDSKQLALLWENLAGEDAKKAYIAIWKMAENQTASIAFLREHLHPAQPVDSARLRQLVRELDSREFKVRENATRQLSEAGQRAAWALNEALEKKPSLEVRRRLEDLLRRTFGPIQVPEMLRNLRAIAVLEQIGTQEACELLERVAHGTPHVLETAEAASALERLKWRR